ncbi:MAG TPA: hypothetical protein VLU43_10910 [Anaeromyxobacteraceae bacterium]|nr:hypothetical protein [Anaeromyxobacteraceae bacterium]
MSFVALLWLPILASAVLVFVLSAATHMVLPWHKDEWGRIADQEKVQAALGGLAPGLYAFPAAPGQRQQMTKEWMDRWAKGPSGWLTVAAPSPISMGRNLGLSFLVFLGVSFVVAYVAAHALGPAPHYRAVFRIVGTVGVLSYAVGPVFNSIWYSRPWRAYAADLLDALIYGLAMAGVFGWLWPR